MSSAAPYSAADRLLHRIAFSGPGLQRGLAELEDTLFKREFAELPLRSPVFITSLPRAGTTLLLEMLARCPEFAAHTYRQMPFVLCPILWDRLSRRLRKRSELKERAHGDGILVSYDSPEAFEEILWKAFWPEKYTNDRIYPISAEDKKDEFEDCFRNHIQKILTVNASTSGTAGHLRYISKNNANISRIEILLNIFPDCHILIPVRNPWDHIRSLRKQHARFLKTHSIDTFSKQYMEWLGHYEFGETLRPIDFGAWRTSSGGLTPEHIDFWLAYWVHAYETVLERLEDNVHLIDYERLCDDPKHGLAKLADVIGMSDSESLVSQADRLRQPVTYDPPTEEIDEALRCRADKVYTALREHGI